MDWFQNKTTQLIALVSIVGTLAGFGYTGATYVNRLENLEAKIGGLGETEDAQQVIEERFASIETQVTYLEKQINSIKIPDNSDTQASVASLTSDVERIWIELDKLEDSKNPLAN
tara:strand:- start:4074 stop:4418 length:345 start_codon:yes stop_codon:yes gene_type:complete